MEIAPGSIYKVTVTEYERGWGQRDCPDLTKYFDDALEAANYAASQDQGTEEIYWRAAVRKLCG
jgi:hypothetical protein